jgi:hypothetical protein
VALAGALEVSAENPDGTSLDLPYNGSVLVKLRGDPRFLRGVQLELSAPQGFLSYHGALAMTLYQDVFFKTTEGASWPGEARSGVPRAGEPRPGEPRPGEPADAEGNQVLFQALPNKLLATWQVPLSQNHTMRNSPYVSVTGPVLPASFPLLYKLAPVIKGISEELETMAFTFRAKPLLSGEGAVRLSFRYPEQMPHRPFTVLIDDEVLDHPAEGEEKFLREGEHNLVILSNDYRNQSRRFMVERAKVLDLTVELQDPTPLIVFEYPEGTMVFLDNTPLVNPGVPRPVEPGSHEVRFQLSDYSIVRPLTVMRGKTYRVALSVDISVIEND